MVVASWLFMVLSLLVHDLYHSPRYPPLQRAELGGRGGVLQPPGSVMHGGTPRRAARASRRL